MLLECLGCSSYFTGNSWSDVVHDPSPFQWYAGYTGTIQNGIVYGMKKTDMIL